MLNRSTKSGPSRLMNWAKLPYELGRAVLVRDFIGPSCLVRVVFGPSCPAPINKTAVTNISMVTVHKRIEGWYNHGQKIYDQKYNSRSIE